MNRDEFEHESPCTEDLSERPEKWRQWFCTHCDKQTHNLSDMTEAQAYRFLADHAGQHVCVSYAADANGDIIFREPEPPYALRMPWQRRGVRLLAAAALAAPLTAAPLLGGCKGDPTNAAPPTPAVVAQAVEPAATGADGNAAAESADEFIPAPIDLSESTARLRPQPGPMVTLSTKKRARDIGAAVSASSQTLLDRLSKPDPAKRTVAPKTRLRASTPTKRPIQYDGGIWPAKDLRPAYDKNIARLR